MKIVETVHRVMGPPWRLVKGVWVGLIDLVIDLARPVPDQWMVVQETPDGWLRVRSVHNSFEEATIAYGALLDTGAPVSMMRPADVDRWNQRNLARRIDERKSGDE